MFAMEDGKRGVTKTVLQQLQLKKIEKLDRQAYVSSITQNGSPDASFCAVALTSQRVEVYDADSLELLITLKAGDVSELHFSPTDNNVLWTCSNTDGCLRAWDLRTNGDKASVELKDDSDGKAKPLLSFDIDRRGTGTLCAGTELVREDAFLLFWDCRSTKLLGGYWESHNDDITQVTFHPTTFNLMASGSTDGLVNIFDVSQSSEDDALQTTLNSVSSVERLQWLPNSKQNQRLACITHNQDLQMWDGDAGCLLKTYTRDYIRNEVVFQQSVDYMVDVLSMDTSEPFLICGNQQGSAFGISLDNKAIELNFQLSGGHSDTVRCALWLNQFKTLLTGGEDGNLCQWS